MEVHPRTRCSVPIQVSEISDFGHEYSDPCLFISVKQRLKALILLVKDYINVDSINNFQKN